MSFLSFFQRRSNRFFTVGISSPSSTGKQFSSRTVDLSEPHLWFPHARKIQRKIICHVGSTNSGKTYNALTALSYARTGIYCGPLRLLAWEVSEKMREKNVRCNLLTGQEKDILDDATHVSCTVEMVDLRRRYDVAVIDECQLLGIFPEDGHGQMPCWEFKRMKFIFVVVHLCYPSYTIYVH